MVGKQIFVNASRVSTRVKLIVVIAILLLVVGASFAAYKKVFKNSAVSTVQTEQEYNSEQLKKAENTELPSGATTAEKVSYYKKLYTTQADNEQYAAAMETFKLRFAADPRSVSYVEYGIIADYSHLAKDDASAREYIDSAIAALPATAAEMDGNADPAIVKNFLLQQRKAYE